MVTFSRATVATISAGVALSGALLLLPGPTLAAPCAFWEHPPSIGHQRWTPDYNSVCMGDSFEKIFIPEMRPQNCNPAQGVPSHTPNCHYAGCSWDAGRQVYRVNDVGRKNCNCTGWHIGPWEDGPRATEVCSGQTAPDKIRTITKMPAGCRASPPGLVPSETQGTVHGTKTCEDQRQRRLSDHNDWCKFGGPGDENVALLFTKHASEGAGEDNPCRISRHHPDGNPRLIYLMWLLDNPAGTDYNRGRGGFPVNLADPEPDPSLNRFIYWRDLLRRGDGSNPYGNWCVFDTLACQGSGGVINYHADADCADEYYPPVSALPACPSTVEVMPQPKSYHSPTPTSGQCGSGQGTCVTGVPYKLPATPSGQWYCQGYNTMNRDDC